MDVVRMFNNELSSLYDVKPPISKAKMTQITKSAIKGIKFYKHIVQSVEKFIQKCRPEYKVPGLYVVDSIVRQSRHQFGADKDVFAPRFTKNINATFLNLFKCADEDRPKIVRVLNLWQKNSVFASDVVQPLMDMANPNVATDIPPIPVSEVSSQKSKSAELASWKGWPQNTADESVEDISFSEDVSKNSDRFAKTTYSNVDTVQTTQTKSKNSKSLTEDTTVKFNKKLLDFDYGDEEDEEEVKADDGELPNTLNPLALSMAQQLLSDPELLHQVQQMQQTIQQNEVEMAMQPQAPADKDGQEQYSPGPPDAVMTMPVMPPYSEQQQHLNVIPFAYDSTALSYATSQPSMLPLAEAKLPMEAAYQHPMLPQEDLMLTGHVDGDERMIFSMPGEPPLPPQDLDERALTMPIVDERIRKDRSRSPSGSRSRGRSGRHRSRSRSPRRRKSRSRSRTRRNHSRTQERDRLRERECEKERRRRKGGIPPIKKNCISVCSTTLWLGHVPKTASGIDINNIFKDNGNILSIDMIPPRGCAYVVLKKRQDAHRALQELKNLKLQGSSIKMAWAPGKGVKGKEFKEYWDAVSGVSYIPFDKVSQNDLSAIDLLEEGGFIDRDSLPQALKDLKELHSADNIAVAEKDVLEKVPDMMLPQVTTAIMPNTTMGMPMVIPQMMQPQFGMPLPGLMPPQSMVVPMPLAVPPPNPLMMVQPTAQTLLAGTPLPVGSIPQMPHLSLSHPQSSALNSIMSSMELSKDSGSQSKSLIAVGDATPTDEDLARNSSPSITSALQSLSTAASSFALGPHVMSRPMLPVMPPVSSAGAPIPFPPPQAFGFPPPPLRPGVPNQNMPGVIPVPNSFPWMHKTSAPVFGSFGDAEIRFPSPGGVNAIRLPTSVNQNPTTPGGNPLVMEHQRPQPPSKESGHKPSQKDKGSCVDNPKNFNNRPSSRSEMFGRHGASSPTSYDDDHDMIVDEHGDMIPADFPREMESARYPGPPDFQVPRGVMRAPWMHGPGPRFPRNMHPGSFQRGGPMHPRMEMEYFRHQGPRMHMSGPHGQQPMWGGNGFPPPPRNQDRYQNRRDYYDNPRYHEEDRERRFHPRDDRGRSRDFRDEPDRRSEDRRHTDSRSEDRDRKPDSLSFSKLPPPKGQKNDMDSDLFRLQSYSNRQRNSGTSSKMNAPSKSKKDDQGHSQPPCQDDSTSQEVEDEKTDRVVETTCDNDEKVACGVPTEQNENSSDSNKNKRDRSDRKRSRWGRTHSEEREFQQQRISTIEMKFQNYENMHQSSQDDASVNGSALLDVPLPNSEGTPDIAVPMDIPVTVQDPVCSQEALPASEDCEIAKDLDLMLCNNTQLSSPKIIKTAEDDPCTDNDRNVVNEPTDSEVPIES